MALASLSWWDASDTWLPAWPSVALVMGANLASTPPRAAAMKPFSARGSPPRHVRSRGAIVDGRTGAGGGAGAGALGGGGGRKGGEGGGASEGATRTTGRGSAGREGAGGRLSG